MKHVDYLYFNIYNYFYRLSLYRSSFNPRTQTMYLFSLGSGGWLLLMEAFYLHFFKHTRFSSPMQSTVFATSIYMLTTVFFNYYFIIKDRDLEIFGKYENAVKPKKKRKRHFFVSVFILAMPYLLLLSLAVFFPRH
ncbi:hypothetical protein ACX0G9_15980 [Flavitalea flava]